MGKEPHRSCRITGLSAWGGQPYARPSNQSTTYRQTHLLPRVTLDCPRYTIMHAHLNIRVLLLVIGTPNIESSKALIVPESCHHRWIPTRPLAAGEGQSFSFAGTTVRPSTSTSVTCHCTFYLFRICFCLFVLLRRQVWSTGCWLISIVSAFETFSACPNGYLCILWFQTSFQNPLNVRIRSSHRTRFGVIDLSLSCSPIHAFLLYVMILVCSHDPSISIPFFQTSI
jgi:hypothetical protein